MYDFSVRATECPNAYTVYNIHENNFMNIFSILWNTYGTYYGTQ